MKKALICTLLTSFLYTHHALAFDYQAGFYQLIRGEFKAALAEFKPLAEKGDAPSQYQMAQIYLNGYGKYKNIPEGIKWLEKAARKEYPEALFNLSVLYSDGKHVKKNLEKAFELMRKAALKNLVTAQFNVGVMYANGQGVRTDYYQAARWYKKAANQNYALAQFNLALMYFEGKGVEKSQYWSYVWNTIAAKRGYKNAETSRTFDARNLTPEQIKVGIKEAEELYNKLVEQQNVKHKKNASNNRISYN